MTDETDGTSDTADEGRTGGATDGGGEATSVADLILPEGAVLDVPAVDDEDDEPDITQLYLLRHAHAGDPAKWEGPDEDRPLSGRGRKQAKRLGKFLDAAGFEPDAILTSPKRRARETAEIVGHELGVEVASNARLASDVGLSALERVLDATGDKRRVVLVGHDPDFSALVALLCGCSRVPMKKGALARIDIRGAIAPGAGTLRWLIPPDVFRKG